MKSTGVSAADAAQLVGDVNDQIAAVRSAVPTPEAFDFTIGGHETATYVVDGELFFASSNDLIHQFDYATDPANVVIDLSDAHVWDASTVATLDAVTTKYAKYGTHVSIVGLAGASKERHDRLTGRLGGEG